MPPPALEIPTVAVRQVAALEVSVYDPAVPLLVYTAVLPFCRELRCRPRVAKDLKASFWYSRPGRSLSLPGKTLIFVTLGVRKPPLPHPKNREPSGIYNGNHHHRETLMLTTFKLLVVAGSILRLALGWGIAPTIPAGAECPTGPR